MPRIRRFAVVVSLSVAATALPVAAHGVNAEVYVVDDGDYLSGIAARLDVRLTDLLRVNDLSVNDIIHPGQRLTVPGQTTVRSPGASGARSYAVRSGDSLSAIADRHNVSLSALLRVNSLTVNTVIYPGDRVTIPGTTAGGSPNAPGGARYTVRPGDWLSAIAARHNVSLNALLRANDLTVNSVIFPGQVVRIPGRTAGTPPAATGGRRYTVRAGDSLSAIADRHGVTLAAVLAANNLTVTTVIHPGQRLIIPGATGGGAPSIPRAPSGARYTVRSGDSLSAIADRHGVSLAALLAVNNLFATSVIYPGTQLTLPAGVRSSPVDRVVGYALAQVGKPYRFFRKGPYAFDCSGLTLAAYAQIGITLVHHSATQARQGTPVDFTREAIRPGDLVFMNTTGGTAVNHVGIAISATSWVQARRPGVGVRVTSLPPDSMILAVRRFVPAS